jgi:hypothetical protein
VANQFERDGCKNVSYASFPRIRDLDEEAAWLLYDNYSCVEMISTTSPVFGSILFAGEAGPSFP